MSEADDKEKAARIRGDLTTAQALKLTDKSDHQGFIAGRRRGKTFGAAAELVIDALENPGGQELYATLTKDHARTLLWDNPETGIKKLAQKYELKLRFDNMRAIAYFDNQSVLGLFGADRTDQLDKARGRGLRRIIVDECASFAPRHLDRFVEQVIEPTLADYLGRLTLAGTPGPRLGGPFFEATGLAFHGEIPPQLLGRVKCRPFRQRNSKLWKGVKRPWSLHQLRWEDAALKHIKQYAFDLKERKSWSDDARPWVNEWLGLWMFDLSTLVYQYEGKFDWKGGELPELPDDAVWHVVGAWHWTSEGKVGVVVCAYSDVEHEVYHLDDVELPSPTLRQMAGWMKKFETEYGVTDWVGTRPGKSKGKGIFHELRDQHGFFCHPGDLTEEYDLIVVANNDLASGLVHVVQDSGLKAQLTSLQWEDPGVSQDTTVTSNALTTAWLYCLRFCNHRGPRQEAPNVGPKPGSPDFLAKQADEAKRRIRERERRASDGTSDWLESELGEIDGDFRIG